MSIIALTVMFTVIACVHASYVDPCTGLQRKNLSGFFLETTTISICLDNGFCSGTIVPLSCENAYIRLAETVESRRVVAPPVVANRRYFVHRPSSDSAEEITNLINGFFSRLSQTADRILANFPRLVYDEEIDGDMLRDLVTKAELLSQFIVSESRTRSVFQTNPVIHQWKWSIRVISDYISQIQVRFTDIDRLLVSAAPFIHAFLRTAYYLPIIPDGELLNCIDYDLLHTIVEYHPRYTNATDDQDGVWFINLGAQDVATLSLEQADDAMRYVIAPVDASQIAEYWGPQFYDMNSFTEFLARQLSNLTAITDDLSSRRSVRKALFTFKCILSESETSHRIVLGSILRDAFLSWRLNDSASIANLVRNPQHVSILRMMKASIQPTDRLKLLPSYSDSHRISPRIPIYQAVSPSTWSFGHEIIRIANFSRHDLSANFDFTINHTTTTNGTRIVPVPFSYYLHRLLEGTFEPSYRIFVPNSDPQAPQRYTLNPRIGTRARPLRVYIGRLMALALRENSGHVLINYLPTHSTGTENIVDTIFFGSWDIRSGFYDVYHDNTLEYMFNNNGSLALMAFHGLGRQAAVAET
jgi:hypothetical protein